MSAARASRGIRIMRIQADTAESKIQTVSITMRKWKGLTTEDTEKARRALRKHKVHRTLPASEPGGAENAEETETHHREQGGGAEEHRESARFTLHVCTSGRDGWVASSQASCAGHGMPCPYETGAMISAQDRAKHASPGAGAKHLPRTRDSGGSSASLRTSKPPHST